MKKKLFITGCSGIPARYGGFETFTENIVLYLTEKFEIFVICSSRLYHISEQEINWKSIKRIFYSIKPNGIFSILYDWKGLIKASKEADYILQLGVGAGYILPLVPCLKSKYLMIHIDGCEWKRTKWNIWAKLFIWWDYKLSLRYANSIILDNKALTPYVPPNYQKKIKYINYGGNHLPEINRQKRYNDSSYALVIARAEPENNLHLILRVFQQNPSLVVKIISNWDRTSYGKKLLKLYSNVPNIHLIEAIYNDIPKLQEYRINCKIYIHGHSAGGTNPSLVEAMYSGIPIIAWDNVFNRVTTHELALYFKTEEDLTEKLLLTESTILNKIAQNMQIYAKQHYTWNIAAQKFYDIIDQLPKT